jgi:hypothetical protein
LQAGPPLCEVPAFAKIPPPQVLALPEPSHVRNVPKGDTMPVGYIVSDPEGNRWQKQSSVTPFGVAYFYSRIS